MESMENKEKVQAAEDQPVTEHNLTELIFILDRSGSMSGLERDTIGGFNSMLERQRQGEGTVLVSTVLFDDEMEVIHDRVDIGQVRPLTDRDYYVRGCTALLDAVGGAIHHIGNVHKYARPEDRPDKTLFIITTDGQENSSRRYDYKRVKKMVERQKERYGWEFIFLGANIDAAAEAERFGVARDRAIDYCCDSAGTALNYEVLSDVVSEMREAEDNIKYSINFARFREAIDKDFAQRGRKR